jgi:hypothetical protein
MTSVSEALQAVGLTRLAHFTPAKSLPHILRQGFIRSSKDLAENAPEFFDPTDRERFDEHPDHVCCSLEFPNGYYLAQARVKPSFQNFPDWVCLLLDPKLLLREDVLFAPCNAAKGRGAYLKSGGGALLGCYSNPSQPGGWTRGPAHHPRAPTDLQAEALVPGPIELSHLLGIVVSSDAAAANEVDRLNLVAADAAGVSWIVAPTFFRREELSSRLRFGGEIEEKPWVGAQG